MLGWLLGSFVAWRLFVSGHEAIAPWANGPILGLVVGAMQSLGLRGSLASLGMRRSTWTASSTLAWMAAIGPWLALATPTSVRIAALAAPGLHAAVVVLLSTLRDRSNATSLVPTNPLPWRPCTSTSYALSVSSPWSSRARVSPSSDAEAPTASPRSMATQAHGGHR